MNHKITYDKEFVFTSTGGLFLTNPEPMLEYIEAKVNELCSVTNLNDLLNKKIEIINDFFHIIKYDKKHSKYPEPFGFFENEQEKQKFMEQKIAENDLVYYLGSIYSNYHERLMNNKRIPMISDTIGTIRYDLLYYRALYEYAVTLLHKEMPNVLDIPISESYTQDQIISYVNYRGAAMPVLQTVDESVPKPVMGEYAFGTTFILPALIERFLIINLKSKIIHDSIDKMTVKLEKGEIQLTKEEQEYYEAFKVKGHKIFFKDYRQPLYDMLVKYHALENTDDSRLLFFEEVRKPNKNGKMERKKITLGSILNSKLAKSNIKQPFFKLLSFLFRADEMNVRNHIMHANNENVDYLCLGITSVMMQLLWDIMGNEIFE